jgi:hypothetical protein
MAKKILLQETIVKKKADKPIHFVPNGKSFGSLDKAKKTFTVTEVDNEKELEKYLEKGNHVYCYTVSDTEDEVTTTILYWDKDRETAMDNFYKQADEL